MAPKFQNLTYGDVIERDEAPNATYVQVADDTPTSGPASVLADLPSEGNAAEVVTPTKPVEASMGEEHPAVELAEETAEVVTPTKPVTGDTEVALEDQIEHLTAAQLKEFAAEHDIDIDGISKKDAIREAVIAELNTRKEVENA